MFAIPSVKYPHNTCIIPSCAKPLGHDTKELGYIVCHEHRLCSKCGGELKPAEVRLCYDLACAGNDGFNNDSLELAHPRCKVVSHATMNDDPTLSIKQSEYDRLNILRLMVDPDMQLANSTNEQNAMIQSSRFVSDFKDDDKSSKWDKMYAHLKMLEACVAQVSICLAQDSKKLKERAGEREKIKAAKAKQEATTSTRPQAKAADDNFEVSLAEFMQNFGIKSRKVALHLQKMRDKAVESLKFSGLPVSELKKQADKMLSDNIAKGLVKVEE